MDVLLSIRPRFAEAIMDGGKKFEFRKNKFAKKDINYAYIYSTSPVKKIIGIFKISNIIEGSPSALWDQLKDQSGISEKEFFDYFNNKETGFALEIKDVVRFEEPLDPKILFPNFVPPQSFCYVNSLQLEMKIILQVPVNKCGFLNMRLPAANKVPVHPPLTQPKRSYDR